MFNGYFSVNNNNNLVTAFYETINGSTNFNNNILLPIETGTPISEYSGFQVNVYNGLWYDNAYLSNWLQFDTRGVIITSMSAYPQANIINLFATTLGDETKNNIGIFIYNNYSNDNRYTYSNDNRFTITPILDPTIYVNNGSKLYDFLNSDREECIITNDISVSFNLRTSNGIKTIVSSNLVKITKI